ncbi:MAG: TIM-barrel domain-containing protein, partial [Myxococcota bacterium]|nr:TIM-barrel domain-containing protein [Myxococcota bacterium]
MKHLSHLLITCIFVAGLHACGGEETTEPDAPATSPGTAVSGDTALLLEDGVLRLNRGDLTLMRFPLDGLQLGVVEALEDDRAYDPWFLIESADKLFYQPPAGLQWLDVEAVTVTEQTETSANMELVYAGARRANLAVTVDGDDRFKLHWMPEGSGDPVAFFRLRPRVDSEEGFYGLGEYFDHVNHRGKARAMQFELSTLESTYNEAHVPIPMLLGTSGWGLFVPCPYGGAFSVAETEDDLVEATFGTGFASSAGLTFYLFTEDHPLDLTQHYYEVTGYPGLPAPWALGPWIWRDEIAGQVAVMEDLETIRALDLATSGYWIDRPFASAVNSFDFHPDTYSDAAGMIQTANDMGFRMALWQAPYIDDDEAATADLLAEGQAEGYFPSEAATMVNKWGPMVDLTNPDAYAWWQSLVEQYTSLGIEGFKLDYGQDIQIGAADVRLPWSFHDGSNELTQQSRFQALYHQVYAETLPEDGGFLLCRSGTYGDQTNGVIIWPGDLDATDTAHGEIILDDGVEVEGVGGLEASMIAGLTLGPSGFPFYGSDTGGYRHAPPSKEVFIRWFQQTALSTVMQVGTNSNDVPWEGGSGDGFDDEVVDLYRIYARLHLRLFPYEWTYAKALAVDGRPIQRALGLAYPEMGEHPWDTYLFGDHLLVAPVVKAEQRERDVLFPPGTWIDWWNGTSFGG